MRSDRAPLTIDSFTYLLQVLDQDQENLRISRPFVFGSYNFTFTNVRYPLDSISQDNCQNVSYICVEFAKGDLAHPFKPRIPFWVVGVVSASNKTEAPSNLIKCLPYPLCEGKCQFENNQFKRIGVIITQMYNLQILVILTTNQIRFILETLFLKTI